MAERFPPNAGRTWGAVVDERLKPTAAGLRALGRPVPKNIPDDECVVLIYQES